MKNIYFSLFIGLTASLLLFIMVKHWEKSNRQHEFDMRAQGHAAAIQAGFSNIAKQVGDVRFLIEYDINKEHKNPDAPHAFMDMSAPLISHEAAFVNISWALKADNNTQADIIYSWKKNFAKNQRLPSTSNLVLTGLILKDNDHYNLRLTSPITNLLQNVQKTQATTLKGDEIAFLITEWNVSKVIEQALKIMPVIAQDVAISVVNANGDETPVHFHFSRSRDVVEKEPAASHAIQYSTVLNFAELRWKLTFKAAPSFFQDFPIILAWQVLIMGLLLTFIFSFYVHKKGRYTEKVEAAVQTQTKELAKSEAHFRSIVQGLQDIYYKTTLDGTIEDVSPAILNMGYTEKEVIGTNISDYYYDSNTRKEFVSALQASSNGKVYNYHIRAVHKNNSIRWVSNNSQFIYDDDGNATGIEGTLRDFTEVREANEKIQHLDRLESLGILAGGIAHDFNNILTAILGNASIARMQINDDSPLVPYMDAIETSSMSAADLCKQMLAYAGKGKYFVKPIDLSATIEDISKLIQISIDKNVHLEYPFHEQLPTIDADSSQIQQLIMNLVLNAAESYEGKAGAVSIKMGVEDLDTFALNHCIEGGSLPEGQYVYIKVSDLGCGIDQALQTRIFEPFYSTKFTGRGLGMSAIRGILRGHHGALHIQSKQGEGTVMKVYFPISKIT